MMRPVMQRRVIRYCLNQSQFRPRHFRSSNTLQYFETFIGAKSKYDKPVEIIEKEKQTDLSLREIIKQLQEKEAEEKLEVVSSTVNIVTEHEQIPKTEEIEVGLQSENDENNLGEKASKLAELIQNEVDVGTFTDRTPEAIGYKAEVFVHKLQEKTDQGYFTGREPEPPGPKTIKFSTKLQEHLDSENVPSSSSIETETAKQRNEKLKMSPTFITTDPEELSRPVDTKQSSPSPSEKYERTVQEQQIIDEVHEILTPIIENQNLTPELPESTVTLDDIEKTVLLEKTNLSSNPEPVTKPQYPTIEEKQQERKLMEQKIQQTKQQLESTDLLLIKGCGPKTAEALKKVGVQTAEQLVTIDMSKLEHIRGINKVIDNAKELLQIQCS